MHLFNRLKDKEQERLFNQAFPNFSERLQYMSECGVVGKKYVVVFGKLKCAGTENWNESEWSIKLPKEMVETIECRDSNTLYKARHFDKNPENLPLVEFSIGENGDIKSFKVTNNANTLSTDTTHFMYLSI